MSAYLDNAPLTLDELGDDASIGQLLEWVRRKLHGTDRLILGLRCNEEVVENEEIAGLLSAPVSDFDRLDVVSGDPRALVKEAVDQARDALDDSLAIVKQAAACLDAGDVMAAMNRLSECFELWGQTHEAVMNGGKLLNLDFQSLEIGGLPFVETLTPLANQLRELKSAIEQRDHVLLRDILRYELDDALASWRRTLDGFADHVRALRGAVVQA
jgi:hypothetical protein